MSLFDLVHLLCLSSAGKTSFTHLSQNSCFASLIVWSLLVSCPSFQTEKTAPLLWLSPSSNRLGSTNVDPSRCPAKGLLFTIWVVFWEQCANHLMGIPSYLKASLHLFLKHSNHLLCLPIEMLSPPGDQVPFYAFFPDQLNYLLQFPCLRLLGSSYQLLSPA